MDMYSFIVCFCININGDKMKKVKLKEKIKPQSYDYYFGKPRIEMAGSECLVDGLQSIIEYSNDKITLNLGTQVITFFGDDLRINSFTREGAIVEGNIISMEFSQ